MKAYNFRFLYATLALSVGAFAVGAFVLVRSLQPSSDGMSTGHTTSGNVEDWWITLKDTFLEPGTVLLPDSASWRAMVAMLRDASASAARGKLKVDGALQQRYSLLYLHYHVSSGMTNNTLSNECTWTGVVCNEDGRVVELGFPVSSIRGSLPTEIVRLQSLAKLNIASKEVTSIEDVVEHLPELTHLVADNNYIVRLPERLPPKLEVLSLAFNQLETLPSTIASLTSLKQLRLGDNENLQGDLTEFLGTSDLEFLDMSMTGLRATLDDSRIYLPSIQKLIATHSGLNLTLSSLMGHWTNLSELDVSYTNVMGSLDSYVSNWSHLSSLSMQEATLDSTLPTEIGLLTNLEFVDLFTNPSLRGTLPTELGQLTAIKFFRIEKTGLTGFIPSQLSSWNELESGFFEAEGLYGDLNICGRGILDLESFCKGGGLSCLTCEDAKVRCPCCTGCSSPDG